LKGSNGNIGSVKPICFERSDCVVSSKVNGGLIEAIFNIGLTVFQVPGVRAKRAQSGEL
jgi:hypothetical protein